MAYRPSTPIGKALLDAADAASARTVIGAGTSSLVIGTTSTTAKAGNYQPASTNISDSTAVGRSLITAASAAAARTAIGAGGGRSSTITIAAANSSAAGKAGADYVCLGDGNDHNVINTAIGTLSQYAGGRIELLEGVYRCSGAIQVDNPYVTIQGQGPAFNTIIATATTGTLNRYAAIQIGVTKVVTGCTVRDLAINSSRTVNGVNQIVSGSGHGIAMACDNMTTDNVAVQYAEKNGFHYAYDGLNPTSYTTIASQSNNVTTTAAAGTLYVASTSGFASSGSFMVRTATDFLYVDYTGKTSTSFTGCSFSWAGESATVTFHTGDVVFTAQNSYNSQTSNTMAYAFGGVGYFIDWHQSSCEWTLARCQGNPSRPTANTYDQHGFVVLGTNLKFLMCHPYYCDGDGMKINDTHSYAGFNIDIIGGEYENNSRNGIAIRNLYNTGYVNISGAEFYGQGSDADPYAGSDLYLAPGAHQITVSNNNFRYAGSTQAYVTKNVYAFGSNGVKFIGNSFWSYGSSIQNLFLDGNGATTSLKDWLISDNYFRNHNAGSRAVYLRGQVSHVVVSNNMTDAPIQEIVGGGYTPHDNSVFGNSFIDDGPGATKGDLILIGPGTRAHDNDNYSGALATRLMGATNGTPSSGVFFKGDYFVDSTNGCFWICTTAGTVGQGAVFVSSGSGRVAAPATASSSGIAGQLAFDSGYVYVCVSSGVWKRAALSSW